LTTEPTNGLSGTALPAESRLRVTDGPSALARIAELKGRMEQSLAAAKNMSERLGELNAVGMDPNGVAKAMVDSSGNLIGLQLSERVYNHPLDFTARMILEATRAAKVALADKTREVIADTVGSEGETGKAVLAGLDERLGIEDDEGEDERL
jgi:DNA-binding protein YbaB